MIYKIDRYSDKYREVFRLSPIYCEYCNGDLKGHKTIENNQKLFFLKCRNCKKEIKVIDY